MTLKKATSSSAYVYNPYNILSVGATQTNVEGIVGNSYNMYGGRLSSTPTNYQEELYQCRFFYRQDPTASTVLNRMAELSAGDIVNTRGSCTDEELQYFDSVAEIIEPIIKTAALQYLIAGMAIPDYATTKIMGSRLNPKLGRKRYVIPDRLWCRNPENIKLKRSPFGADRIVYLRIPPDEMSFITNKGVFPDGTEDKELYAKLVSEFPDYVAAILAGKSYIPLPNVRPIYRKLQPDADYPQPFLVPALSALKHKLKIKEMDHSIATRAIEAIQLVKAGNDEFPVTEDDTTLEDLRNQMLAKSNDALKQLVYSLYTDHTIDISWVYPPMEALLSPNKYESIDADIYMAMGFSRMLLVGEQSKSNSGAGPSVILGPMAMLEELRCSILDWVDGLYEEMADLNGFTNIPDPEFEPLTNADSVTLVANAAQAYKNGIISKDLYARLFGSNFEQQNQQIEFEKSRDVLPDQSTQIKQEVMPQAPPTTN